MPTFEPGSISDELLALLASLCIDRLERWLSRFPQQPGVPYQATRPRGNYPLIAPPALSIELVTENVDHQGEIIPIIAYRATFTFHSTTLPTLAFLIPKIYVIRDYLRRHLFQDLVEEWRALLSGHAPVNGLMTNCAFAYRDQMRRLLTSLDRVQFQVTLPAGSQSASFRVSGGHVDIRRHPRRLITLRIRIDVGYSIILNLPVRGLSFVTLWRSILVRYP